MSLNDFPIFSKAVHANLVEMSKGELFVVDGLDIYTSYLLAFPDGTNPIFRTNTEHDCSCCKQFIRNMGGLVSIVGGKKRSIWECEGLPYPYDVVAQALDTLVKQLPIKSVFRTKEHKFGAQQTVEHSDSGVIHWDHFYGTVAKHHRHNTPDEARGAINTTAQVLKRGLEELRLDALETVLDLIESNGIYRGAEFKKPVQEFLALLRAYNASGDKDLCVWSSINSPVARFRNTAIGTLVQDLSEGVELDRAVRAFEAKVAPTNYKRPTALVTPKMIDAALKTLADLDLERAVERRFARISDISVNDVLFVHNSVRGLMKNELRTLLYQEAKPSRAFDAKGATAIDINSFVSNVLPNVTSMEALVKNRHISNFVSLTAPVHENTGRLFKWSNDFAWSYDGEVADSIKQRVKAAGGNINAALRVSLSWFNFDDLDLHAECPDGHVYFGNKKNILDVDMNAHFGRTRTPVENLSWVMPRDGNYVIKVHQFSLRETKDVGFVLEVECNGEIKQFSHAKAIRDRVTVTAISFTMTKGVMSNLKVMSQDLVGGDISVSKWGVTTETFVPVSTLLNSPNHWHGTSGVGNKHWFFMLEGCKNPDAARGIYNEFLRSDLEPHRKVFEILASKTKCQPAEDQLSGLGFSAGRNDEVVVKVTNANGNRAYAITF